jgi:hypothetical protein
MERSLGFQPFLAGWAGNPQEDRSGAVKPHHVLTRVAGVVECAGVPEAMPQPRKRLPRKGASELSSETWVYNQVQGL